jgi:ferredoxin
MGSSIKINLEVRDAIIESGAGDVVKCYQCGRCMAACPWNLLLILLMYLDVLDAIHAKLSVHAALVFLTYCARFEGYLSIMILILVN